MITSSIIQKSQLEDSMRIDAEFFEPEYLLMQKLIEKSKYSTLREVSEKIVNFGAYSLNNYIEYLDHGAPFLFVGDIRDNYIDLENVKYIDEKLSKELLHKSLVTDGQVLLTIAGTIGNAAVSYGLPSGTNSNQAIANIYPKKSINPYFLAAFLNCKYGKMQSKRYIISNVQPNLLLTQVKRLLIPLAKSQDQQGVAKIVIDALLLRTRSLELYKNAEKLLLQELGLADFQIPDDLAFEVNFSDVKGAHRTDADYLQPKFEVLESKLKQNGAKRFSEVIIDVPATFNPLTKSDDSFKYVELANINSSIGVIDGYEGLLGKETPSRARRILKSGDVIVSSVEGSLEKVALVVSEQEGYLASTGFFQLRSKEILPEALLVISKSLVFQMQLKKRCAGTILMAVPKESISNILIPLLPKLTQQKITDLVRKSHEARKKSKELLEEAKREVEEMIEKGGE